MLIHLISSLMLILVATSANASHLQTEKCVANHDFFRNDKCTNKSAEGTCSIQLAENHQLVQVSTNNSNFVGEITSVPVYGDQDIMNINFGGLVRGTLYRTKTKMTRAEIYINDDSTGTTYTKLTCYKK